MHNLILISTFMFAAAFLRADCDKKNLPLHARLGRGLLMGAIFAAVVLYAGIDIRKANGAPDLQLKDVILGFSIFMVMGGLSALKKPKDEAESLRELLDDPENITPNQRIEAAKERQASKHKNDR